MNIQNQGVNNIKKKINTKKERADQKQKGKKDKVLSIGELVVEFFIRESGHRFDEPGNEYIGPFASGAPAIFIDTVGKLGLDCGFIGTVGDDDFGKVITDRLKRDSVDISRIKILNNVATGTAFTTYFNDGSRKYLYHIKECAPGRFGDDLLDEEYINKFTYLHISGNVLLFSECVKKACLKAVDMVLKNNGRITFDPNVRIEILNEETAKEANSLFFNMIKKAFIFFPSRGEIEAISGIGSEKEAVKYFFNNTELEYIAVKKGADGSTIYTRKKHMDIQTSDKGLVKVDPTGAGDCYCGGFLYGIIKGWDIYKVGDFANQIGRKTVSVLGPMEGDFSEILKRFNE